ncbi:unnamed protein product [Paramecium octaurelia]|uniref:Uncharacterized protein n=1 Tax=Paramecium octaurelia TaxID=43137 RepID=A0A8S1YL47_PAROT|nr:unnamed protein product [Paramecium octaurelia]
MQTIKNFRQYYGISTDNINYQSMHHRCFQGDSFGWQLKMLRITQKCEQASHLTNQYNQPLMHQEFDIIITRSTNIRFYMFEKFQINSKPIQSVQHTPNMRM